MVDYIFVSDFFSDQVTGGAELTTEAFLEGKENVERVNSRNVDLDFIKKNISKYWIFGNFSGIDFNLIPTIIHNLKYFVIEYDYKFCKYRSEHKHIEAEGVCNCHNESIGKLVSTFYHGAEKIFWMSDGQKENYFKKFPFLKNNDNFTISSAFTKDSLKKLEKNTCKSDGKYLILNSNSWIKNTNKSIEHAKERKLDYKLISNLSYEDMLNEIASSEGLIFLPSGYDTCPRLVIEAKLLGLDLILNDNVQHKNEAWFKTKESAFKYLSNRQKVFWSEIDKSINKHRTISGYTTTYNCVSQKYPFIESIKSMLGFCDEVIVVDGGSDDGTLEKLNKLKDSDDRVKIIINEKDWNNKRFAVFDGDQKAVARSYCNSDWCWQQDSDEIVHEKDYEKVQKVIKMTPKSYDLVALPVIEYWGKNKKVRIDINPWKWRLSKNKDYITHGIPNHLRLIDQDGQLYARQGTDGCDYVNKKDFSIIPFVNFYTQEVHHIKGYALSGNEKAQEIYENWFNNIINNFPSVFHYSWYDLERKINTYKNYWSKHWQSLYDIDQNDTPENNMFFNKPWSEVTDSDISSLAKKLEKEMGGWIFHRKVDFNQKTPWMYIEREDPKVMENYQK
tara:strand:+ start:969 stop:2816 length:1848 start_codon:yes stop_codon:yes gene_type:complete